MAETWPQAYGELKKYKEDNPAIEIDMNCVAIPGDIRPEFYRRFDAVRAGFTKERFAGELEKAYALSRAYGETSKAIKEKLALESIEVNGSLNWFLLDPLNGLMRVLFDPLFDLVKGKTDMAAFTSASDVALGDAFKSLFREGYERWGTLALMKGLDPDGLWLGHTHDFYTDSTMEGDIIEGNRDDFVPDPVESKKLVFDNLVRASFVVPGAIVHSGRLNSYVSLRPRWYLPRRKARMWSDRLEWMDMKKIIRDFGQGNLWPDLMLYVTDQRPDELKLVADYYRIARPEIIVEFMEEDGWYDARRVEDIMRHNMVLTPRLGSYVISRVKVPAEAFKTLEAMPMAVPAPPVAEGAPESATAAPAASISASSGTPAIAPEAAPPPPPMARPLSLADLPAGVHVISAGYDANMLEPVIKALAETTAMIKAASVKGLNSG